MTWKKFGWLPAAVLLAVISAGCSGDDVDKKMSVALADAKQGKWEKARKSAAEISEIAPAAAAPMLLQAIAYEKNGEIDKALDLARQCAAANPDDFTSIYTFGRLSATDKMRRSEAFGILENALKLNPGDRDTLVLLCNLGIMLQHPRVGQYLEELRRKPEFATSPTLYYQYGIYCARQKNKPLAIAFLRHCVKQGGGSNPALILNAARCMDHYKLSTKETLAMYRFYLNHPGKNANGEKEVRRRIAALEIR